MSRFNEMKWNFEQTWKKYKSLVDEVSKFCTRIYDI